MDDLQELALHAKALSVAVEQSPEFFASINHYVHKLANLAGVGGGALTQRELDVLCNAIDTFFKQWRPLHDPLYVPPREAADADPTVRVMVELANRLVHMPEAEFQALVDRHLSQAPHGPSPSTPAPAAAAPHTQVPDDWNARLRKHWLVTLVVVCVAVAGTTWTVALSVLVAPRDFTIGRLQRELDDLRTTASRTDSAPTNPATAVLEDVGVLAGAAATTRDGGCTITVLSATGRDAEIALAVAPDSTQHVVRVQPGTRVPLHGPAGTYLVVVHGIRGNIVDLSVFRSRK